MNGDFTNEELCALTVAVQHWINEDEKEFDSENYPFYCYEPEWREKRRDFWKGIKTKLIRMLEKRVREGAIK